MEIRSIALIGFESDSRDLSYRDCSRCGNRWIWQLAVSGLTAFVADLTIEGAVVHNASSCMLYWVSPVRHVASIASCPHEHSDREMVHRRPSSLTTPSSSSIHSHRRHVASRFRHLYPPRPLAVFSRYLHGRHLLCRLCLRIIALPLFPFNPACLNLLHVLLHALSVMTRKPPPDEDEHDD